MPMLPPPPHGMFPSGIVHPPPLIQSNEDGSSHLSSREDSGDRRYSIPADEVLRLQPAGGRAVPRDESKDSHGAIEAGANTVASPRETDDVREDKPGDSAPDEKSAENADAVGYLPGECHQADRYSAPSRGAVNAGAHGQSKGTNLEALEGLLDGNSRSDAEGRAGHYRTRMGQEGEMILEQESVFLDKQSHSGKQKESVGISLHVDSGKLSPLYVMTECPMPDARGDPGNSQAEYAPRGTDREHSGSGYRDEVDPRTARDERLDRRNPGVQLDGQHDCEVGSDERVTKVAHAERTKVAHADRIQDTANGIAKPEEAVRDFKITADQENTGLTSTRSEREREYYQLRDKRDGRHDERTAIEAEGGRDSRRKARREVLGVGLREKGSRERFEDPRDARAKSRDAGVENPLREEGYGGRREKRSVDTRDDHRDDHRNERRDDLRSDKNDGRRDGSEFGRRGEGHDGCRVKTYDSSLKERHPVGEDKLHYLETVRYRDREDRDFEIRGRHREGRDRYDDGRRHREDLDRRAEGRDHPRQGRDRHREDRDRHREDPDTHRADRNRQRSSYRRSDSDPNYLDGDHDRGYDAGRSSVRGQLFVGEKRIRGGSADRDRFHKIRDVEYNLSRGERPDPRRRDQSDKWHRELGEERGEHGDGSRRHEPSSKFDRFRGGERDEEPDPVSYRRESHDAETVDAIQMKHVGGPWQHPSEGSALHRSKEQVRTHERAARVDVMDDGSGNVEKAKVRERDGELHFDQSRGENGGKEVESRHESRIRPSGIPEQSARSAPDPASQTLPASSEIADAGLPRHTPDVELLTRTVSGRDYLDDPGAEREASDRVNRRKYDASDSFNDNHREHGLGLGRRRDEDDSRAGTKRSHEHGEWPGVVGQSLDKRRRSGEYDEKRGSRSLLDGRMDSRDEQRRDRVRDEKRSIHARLGRPPSNRRSVLDRLG
jgi:hypothetical protein